MRRSAYCLVVSVSEASRAMLACGPSSWRCAGAAPSSRPSRSSATTRTSAQRTAPVVLWTATCAVVSSWVRCVEVTWAVTAAERDEEKLSEEDIKGWTLTFKGNKLIGKGRKADEQTFTLDPAKKPKEIDITPKAKGIYELEGDRLTLRVYFDGSARPTSPKGALKKGEVLIVLKREKR